MTENTTGKSTNELLMRVLQVESPELFDGSDGTSSRLRLFAILRSGLRNLWR